MIIPALLVLALAADPAQHGDAMPFPGPAVSQTLPRDLTFGNNILTASFATNNLSSRIHYSQQRPTFLLDESAATVGSRSRGRNPRLQAILLSGSVQGIGYTDRTGERVIFSPKAFAVPR